MCLFALLSLAGGAVAGGPSASVQAALADVQTRPALERPFLRYLKLDHLPAAERQEMWQVISGALNGTSRRARIAMPVVILLPAKGQGQMEEAIDPRAILPADWNRAILIRFNYGDYGYERSVIETLAKVEPHFHFREKRQQLTEVKVVAPAPVFIPVPTGGVQVYIERGGVLSEVADRNTIQASDIIYVRDRIGGPLRRFTMEDAKKEAVIAPAKAVKKDEQTLHGAWLPPAEIAALATATNSDSPIQLADWFWWQVSIQSNRAPGPGYYDLLGVKDQNEFHERVGFDPKLFKARFKEFVNEYRAAQKTSGVSQQPRRISVEDKLGGEIWVTFDNEIALDRSNPLETPNGEFKFNATEQFAHLPNGMLAQGLFVGNDPKAGKEGDRQDSAPDFIGGDKTATGNSSKIEVGICWRCHSEGLKPVNDYFQKTFKRTRIGGPDYQKIVDLQEKYFGRLQEKLKLSTERHAAAVMAATGLTLPKYSAAIGNRWRIFEDTEVTLQRASRELGCTPERLLGSLRAYKSEGKLNGFTVLDGWLDDEKETIPLRQWLAVVSEAHKALAASGVKP